MNKNDVYAILDEQRVALFSKYCESESKVDKRLTIQNDGVAYSGTYYGGGSHTRPPNDVTNATIGSWNHSVGREFKGKIAFLKIYNRELSSAEINQNYNALKNRFI